MWTLEQALAAYCAPEALSEFRNVRGEDTPATRAMQIARAPRVLLIHLKLFAFTERGACPCGSMLLSCHNSWRA